jgi:hypothetical protein
MTTEELKDFIYEAIDERMMLIEDDETNEEYGIDEDGIDIRDFEEEALMTRDKGLVIRVNGKKFYLTIQKA